MDYAYVLRCFLPALALVVVVMIISVNVIPRFDRARIREHMEEHGGKVLEIIRVVGPRADRYQVTYLTAHGERIKATCQTSQKSGVYWISDYPPGLFADEGKPARTC